MSFGDYLVRQCPICQNNTNSRIVVSSRNQGELMDYDSLRPYWNGFFKEKVFFSYVRCAKCSLLYTPTFYHQGQLEELYGQMAPNMDLVPLQALVKTQKGYFKELKRFSSLENGYIEVGPDIGIFTANCSKEGSHDRYWLFEPNKAVAQELAKNVGPHAYTIIEEMFGFEVIPDSSAGVAVMIQVLDHLLDPVATLRELKTKLLPDSKLLLVTHNEQSFLRKIVGRRWPAFCLQHPQIYSPKSIAALLEKSGFRVDSIKRSTNYFELSFLLKHLLWAFGIRVESLPRLFNFTVGLKLGNIITIATPK